MERKTSLVIGVRTRQNILKGKVVRKLEDGCDNFEDYWTDSDDESSTVSKSSVLSSELTEEMPNIQFSNFSSASEFKENRNSRLKSKTVHSQLKSTALRSPLKSTALRSPLKSTALCSPLKSTALNSPLKSKAVHSPLKSKPVHSPLKSKPVHSPLKSKPVHSPLKSKPVHSPLKSKPVHSPLKSKAVHSPLKSKVVHSPLKSKAVHSPLKSKSVHSPLKSKSVHSPLKSKSVHSPLKSKSVHSPLKSKSVHSPLKSKRVLYNDTVNVDGVVNVNKETSATEFGDKTVNLGVDNNNPETETLNEDLDKIARNKLPKVPSAEIQEIHSSPLSRTFNKSELLVSKISFTNSKKSISRSTKPNPKTKKSQSQFDELDEKIMQMINLNHDENEIISNSSEEEMSLSKENSSFIEEKSKVTEQTMSVSGNIEDNENFSDDESPNESIERNSKSLNQSINDSESLSFENVHVKKTEGSSKHKNDKQKINLQEKYFTHSKSTGEKTVTSGTSQLKEKSSDIFISKKTSTAGSSHTADISVNSHEDLSYSESDIDKGETQANKPSVVSKNSLQDNYLNTHVNSLESSRTADISVNSHEDLSYSESDIDTGETQANKPSVASKNSLPDNYLNTHVNSPENTDDVINSDTDSPSKNTRKQGKNNAQKRKILADQHSSKNLMPQKSLPSSTDSNSFLKKSKLHKNDALSRSTVAVEIESNIANIDDVSESTSADISNMDDNSNTSEVYINQKEKTTNNKSDFIPDENNLSATSFNESSHFQTIKRRKTYVNKRNSSIPEGNDDVNTSMSFSEDYVNISEVNMEKPAKKQKKNENDKNGRRETHRKSCFIPQAGIKTADFDNLSKLRTSTRRRTRNKSIIEENDVANTSMNFSEKSLNVSKVNTEKITKKQEKNKNLKKRKKETDKKSLILHEDIVEGADHDNCSQLQTSKRRRTRNSSITEEKNSVNNFSGVNDKKTNKNGSKIEKNKNRQKSALNESVFIADNDIYEKDDLSLSQLQTLKNSSHRNSVNIEKTTKTQRTNKKGKSNDAKKTPGSFQQKTKKQKKSESARNNFISEENDHADASMNFSENCSANNVSVINNKKTTKRQKKVETGKGRFLCDESDIENNCQSKAQSSGKSKSNLPKNNINKENELNDAPIRRSTRERFAPLARWRNERLCYGFRDGNIETFGIDKGTNEDADFLKSIYKKQRQKQKIRKPKALSILDVVENKKKRVHLHKKFPLIPWDSPLHCKTEENPSHAFLIKRMLETNKNSFGYVHIDANKTKPPQYMPEEDLLLTAIEGRVEINLHDNVYILEKKDMFIVPRGTAYNITNIGKMRALLSYVVGKFKFLDDF